VEELRALLAEVLQRLHSKPEDYSMLQQMLQYCQLLVTLSGLLRFNVISFFFS
jgi:hypothetical protein